ncbi:ABC transporter permease [Candidatus Bipolaricaulota bacterium]|nr:ABC transporter permease [Candidatus Bipolaricaulota bacterium]MCK4683270.1 ABC transporter permease [Candidatus Bipolaricaulota bacterium]
MNKGFVIMTVLLPALIGLIILVTSLVERGASSSGSPNPPPFLIAVFLAALLFLGAFISGVMVFYGVLKEKGSRVVELMLSSVSAKDLMAGKIIGLGLAGLIQVLAWTTLAYFAARRFLPITLSGLSPMQLISYPLYFILGYLLIATLYATAASTMKDVHSGGAQGMVGFIVYMPMIFLKMLIEHPDLPWIRIAGFFPPFAPSVMMIRMAVTEVAWWEVVLSLTLLAATVCLLARFAAKVFEVGMLMYGKSARLREIWRWGIHSSRT